jgi:hypothetical protein
MLQIQNETPFQVDRALLLDAKGGHVWVVTIKATYRLDDRDKPAVHETQEPVILSPKWSGEPGKSSLLRESELTVEHPGTDVTFNATACAPEGRKVHQLDVGVMVGQLKKMLRVFGERVWYKGLGGLTKTAPLPFERIPIVWERAYGGTEDARNPIGRGFATTASNLVEQPLPNIEDLAHPIQSWKDRPHPAGLGAIPVHWSPRRELGGTYNEAWRRRRMPLWPEDYDARFHQAAPPGLSSQQPLHGGEIVSTVGLVPAGKLTFQVPREHLVVETRHAGNWSRQRVHLERLIVEPSERKVLLVWSARLNCATRGRDVEVSRVYTKVRAEL